MCISTLPLTPSTDRTRCGWPSRRGDLPVTVVLGAEQTGEARGRVEVRQAQPVDGAVDAHQGSRVEISDDGVILDALAHEVILAGSSRYAGARAHGRVPVLRLLH